VPAGIHRKRPERVANPVGARRTHDEMAVERGRRSQAVRRDLVTDGAGHAVARQAVAPALGPAAFAGRREHDSRTADGMRCPVRGRHVAGGAFVLDLAGALGMIDRLPAHAGLEIRIAR
jgi:hypothetical protein